MPQEEFEVWKVVTFEAAHSLPGLPAGHKCREPHGHSYRMEVHCRGPLLEPQGWVVDYAEIADAVDAEVLSRIDHRVLNDVPGLEEPTTENLARWIWSRLAPRLPTLSSVVIQETHSSGCVYSGG